MFIGIVVGSIKLVICLLVRIVIWVVVGCVVVVFVVVGLVVIVGVFNDV